MHGDIYKSKHERKYKEQRHASHAQSIAEIIYIDQTPYQTPYTSERDISSVSLSHGLCTLAKKLGFGLHDFIFIFNFIIMFAPNVEGLFCVYYDLADKTTERRDTFIHH